MRAGTLVVDIAANVARLSQDMAQAKGVVESAMRDVSRAASVAGGVLATLGVGVSIAGITNIARESIKATAALDDMAEVTGASVEQLSRLQVVARTGGQDLATVQDGLVRLTKGLKGSGEETKNAAAALQFLGLQAKDAAGNLRDPGVLMQEIAIRLDKFEDGAGKTALALDLFGKSGANLLPFLKDLAEAGTVNARVTAEQAAQAEVFEKNLKRLTQASEDAKREFVMGITPALVEFTEQLLAAQKAGFGLAGALQQVVKYRMGMGGATPEEVISDADRQIKVWSNPGWGSRGADTGLANAQARRRFGLGLQAQAALEGRTGGAFQDSRDLRVHGPKLRAGYSGAAGAAGKPYNGAVSESEEGNEADDSREIAEALKSEAEALKAASDQWTARNSAMASAQAATRDQVKDLEFEISIIGKSTAEREVALAQRRIEAELKALMHSLDGRGIELSFEEIEKLKEETDARKALVGELVNTRVAKEEAFKAGEDAAKKYQEGLQRQSDSISRTITDALMRGFEGGKDAAENFRDTLKNLFKTLVLEPTIRPVGQAVAGGMAGMFGMPGVASAGGLASGGGGGGGGGGFSMSNLSSLSNLVDTGSLISTLTGGAGLSIGGATVGASIAGLGGTVGTAAALGELGMMASAGTAGLGAAGIGAAAAIPVIGWGIAAAALLYSLSQDDDSLVEQEVGLRHPAINQSLLASDPFYRQAAQDMEAEHRQTHGVTWTMPNANGDGSSMALGAEISRRAASLRTTAGHQLRMQSALSAGGNLTGNLQGYVAGMQVSEYLSPTARLAGAQGQFNSTLARAQAGDPDAASLLGGSAQALLGAGREVYASGPGFQSLFTETNRRLIDALRETGQMQSEVLSTMPAELRRNAEVTVTELRRMTEAVTRGLAEINTGLRSIGSGVA